MLNKMSVLDGSQRLPFVCVLFTTALLLFATVHDSSTFRSKVQLRVRTFLSNLCDYLWCIDGSPSCMNIITTKTAISASVSLHFSAYLHKSTAFCSNFLRCMAELAVFARIAKNHKLNRKCVTGA